MGNWPSQSFYDYFFQGYVFHPDARSTSGARPERWSILVWLLSLLSKVYVH